ncbi:hypothetical protein K4F52_002371 [Lecanicillium sp. MT-2017a]|nr:hypothetical protein K4F52_002371 [Lecanicillium sp. MT-2017a]
MAPTKSKKRGSGDSTKQRAGVAVPLKDAPSTPTHRSPIKKRAGITLQQKKTLIENLQLEITERARRLRAQYHLQAQGLRSRVEIRVNRIPTSMRKMKMGDLLLKYLNQEQNAARPPVPAKDSPRNAATSRVPPSSRAPRRLSDICRDKENDVENEGAKKRGRGAMGDKGFVRPAQVLSPTSSNSRLVNQGTTASPAKAYHSRPGSPLKSNAAGSTARATSVLSSMVERAKAVRSGTTRKPTNPTPTPAKTRTGTTATTAKTRRGGGVTKQPASRPATRTGRRASNHSETSEGSATTVVRKAAPSKASTATNKKSVMGSIRKGAAPKKATAPTTSSSGRVLRKRT